MVNMADDTVPVKITKQHDSFLSYLVSFGYYASKAEANRAGILLLMEQYPNIANHVQNIPNELRNPSKIGQGVSIVNVIRCGVEQTTSDHKSDKVTLDAAMAALGAYGSISELISNPEIKTLAQSIISDAKIKIVDREGELKKQRRTRRKNAIQKTEPIAAVAATEQDTCVIADQKDLLSKD